ncbi:MAG: hypothetical protein HYS98_00375 [Deltaproteobacteria bacterium]|nr:hypothetical protein [Deltaproteobacteria bacterium]
MKVIIIGAGSCATIVADILLQDRNFKLCGFIGIPQEEKQHLGEEIYGNVPFLGTHDILDHLKNDNIFGFVAAIKNNALREKAYYRAMRAGLIPINVISPHAVLDPSAVLGKGVVLSAGCIVSHGVSIGDNTILNPTTVIGIRSRIEDHCFFSTGTIVEGRCHIMKNVFCGVRSTLLAGLTIGKNQHIEFGSIVKESLQNIARSQFEV